MNRHEKISWFTLTFCFISIAGFLSLLPFVGVMVASAMFGFLGFAGFAQLVFKEEQPLDERDRAILRRAQVAGHLAFWGFFVLIMMGTWGWNFYRGIETITIQFLPLMVFYGMVVVITVQSIATIVLYRSGVVQ